MMNNKNVIAFRNGLLSLTLLMGATFAQAADSKMAAGKDTKMAAAPVAKMKPADTKEMDKRKAENVKFFKENSKLSIEHLEKMRANNIKNTNVMFDRMVANQKEFDKMNEESMKGKAPSQEKFKAKGEEFKKENDKAQAELQAQSKVVEEKFQAMMKKRQEEMSKINQAPLAPAK
ncbi:MAG: hypothetical protein H7336_13315 [Bacteriovorax sp.]|nr:hypothetical protein [Bacteriovorax sp.]